MKQEKTFRKGNIIMKLLIVGFVILLAGCTSIIQSASISEAYKSYENKNYQEALNFIHQAESINETKPEMKAELTYLKAQTYEQMGDDSKANALYKFLSVQHTESQYGYLAHLKLKSK